MTTLHTNANTEYVENVRTVDKTWGQQAPTEPSSFDPAAVRTSVLEETRRLADQAHDTLYKSITCLRVVDPNGAARYDRLLRDVADYADSMLGKL